MQQAVVPLFAPGDGDAGSGDIPLAAVASDDHLHAWRLLPHALGLFACREQGCLWYAVCPVCCGSLDVALRVCEGIEGVALYWCPAHQGGGDYDGQP